MDTVVDWKVSAFLTNTSELLQTLAQNFSIPAEDINTVLNARINFTEVGLVIAVCGVHVWLITDA